MSKVFCRLWINQSEHFFHASVLRTALSYIAYIFKYSAKFTQVMLQSIFTALLRMTQSLE